MKIKLLTFNVQHMRNYNYRSEDRIDFPAFASAISGIGADIVGLNEVRSAGALPGYTDQVNAVASAAGYPHTYFAPAIMIGGTSPYGNAMMSRYPFKAETVPIPDPADATPGRGFETRCILRAEYHIGGKRLSVISVHFGLNPSEAENAVAEICRITDSDDCPTAVMGDFNLTPDSPLLMPLRRRFYDTAQITDGSVLTFPSDAPDRKIDFILTRDVYPVSARVCDMVVSDHRPCEAVIEL